MVHQGVKGMAPTDREPRLQMEFAKRLTWKATDPHCHHAAPWAISPCRPRQATPSVAPRRGAALPQPNVGPPVVFGTIPGSRPRPHRAFTLPPQVGLPVARRMPPTNLRYSLGFHFRPMAPRAGHAQGVTRR